MTLGDGANRPSRSALSAHAAGARVQHPQTLTHLTSLIPIPDEATSAGPPGGWLRLGRLHGQLEYHSRRCLPRQQHLQE